MASGGWSGNLEHVSTITQEIVDKWANDTARIPRAKQQKGYSNFIEGYIHDVEGADVNMPSLSGISFNSAELNELINQGGLLQGDMGPDLGQPQVEHAVGQLAPNFSDIQRQPQQQVPPAAVQVNHTGQPYVEIIEQPKQRGLRFRYKCEGRSAGSIPGETSSNEQRTYPTIRINNYDGPSAIVVVSCVTTDEPARPHPHSLVGKDCNKGVCTVKLKNSSHTVGFPNLGIQCATRKAVQEALEAREKIRVDPFGTGYRKDTNKIDLNIVRLCFQVFLPDDNNKFTRIVQPVVSQAIYDKKAVNDLIICRLSKQAGYAKGGDEVFLLCEKVNKDDIQVRFYEDSGDGPVWEAYGEFAPNDVHRQFAIVFKTPQYKSTNIGGPVQVYVQLVRPSDEGCSDPKPFQYIPDDPDPDGINAKRKRKSNINLDFFTDMSCSPLNILPSVKAEASQQVGRSTPTSNVKEKLKQKVIRGSHIKSESGEAAGSAMGAANHTAVPHYSYNNLGGATTSQQQYLLQQTDNPMMTTAGNPPEYRGSQNSTLAQGQLQAAGFQPSATTLTAQTLLNSLSTAETPLGELPQRIDYDNTTMNMSSTNSDTILQFLTEHMGEGAGQQQNITDLIHTLQN